MSQSQLVRVETERWLAARGFCLACESDRLTPTKANTPARDFVCTSCGHPYELKAGAKPFGNRIVDGGYAPMLQRINDGTAPTLFLMRYKPDWQVSDLIAVHRSLITTQVIQERTALSSFARRAGWVGCNILLQEIPPEGRILVIQAGLEQNRSEVRAEFGKAESLSGLSANSRGWTTALLSRLHRLSRAEFTLQDAYALEPELQALFPGNHHVQAKIRQQLQLLRDAGIVQFQERGSYRLTKFS